MADRQMGYSATMTLVIVLVLAILALAAWRFGLFQRDTDEDTETAYTPGVTDASGGELVVVDPNEPRIEDLELPETPMTPVPPSEAARPAPRASAQAE
jgi:hypothetical protein